MITEKFFTNIRDRLSNDIRCWKEQGMTLWSSHAYAIILLSLIKDIKKEEVIDGYQRV